MAAEVALSTAWSSRSTIVRQHRVRCKLLSSKLWSVRGCLQPMAGLSCAARSSFAPIDTADRAELTDAKAGALKLRDAIGVKESILSEIALP